MAEKVFFSVTMSLDGFIAPEERTDDPDVQRWMAQWMELQQWIFPQRFFRENLKLGEGGEEGRDNDIVRETFERTGASVMGKRMFDLGEQAWPEEAPFHTPVFVVTHEPRDPWERPGGTTFFFVNDGIETALDQAREAAGDRDVRIVRRQLRKLQLIARQRVHRLPGRNAQRDFEQIGGCTHVGRVARKPSNISLNQHQILSRIAGGGRIFAAIAKPNLMHHHARLCRYCPAHAAQQHKGAHRLAISLWRERYARLILAVRGKIDKAADRGREL